MKKLVSLMMAMLLVLSCAACANNKPAESSKDEPSKAESVESSVEESSAAAESSVEESSAEESKAEAQKLIVGFDAEFPPFGFVAEDGSYDGFDLAMAKEICTRLGWEFEAQPIDWNFKDQELEAGNINCIWNGFTCTGREDEYTWSDAYVDNSIVVVVKADSEIKTLADMAGKVLMVQKASSGSDAVNSEDNKAFKDSLKEIVELKDYNTGFMDLNQGTVDAIAVDAGVAAYQIANNSGSYVVLEEALSTEQYAVGFKKGNTELCSVINEELKKLAEDGTMLEIAKKYEEAGLVIDSLCLIKK